MRPFTALAATALLAGCAVGGRATTADEPRLPPVTPELRAEYLSYWDAYLAATAKADPDDAGLAEHVGSPYLDALKARIESDRRGGRTVKGTVEHHLEGMELEGMAADGTDWRVVDCVDLDKWLIYDLATGQPVAGQLVDRPSQRVSYTMRERDGRWRITASTSLGDC